MAKATQQQIKALRTLTRRANRRLERATPGQRTALEYFVRNYTGGAGKFSAAAKGLSFEEVALKLKNLDKFLGAKTTTRKGWDEVKADNVHKANERLKSKGYTLTDEELAEIFIQIDEASLREKYRVINLVEAKKLEAVASGEWDFNKTIVSDFIANKASEQQSFKKLIAAREKYT